uniref:Cation-transporting P-type ATPase N-terminal domain-containing protein n=1 Tax=Plectus sambesii TaxID=2011161 RepID=A0A914WUB4_9BILA
MNKLKSWIKGKFGHGSDNKKDDDGEGKPKKGQKEAERSLEKQFTEHQMTLEELSQEYPDSGINADKPDNSSGLSSGDAKARLEKDGPNALKPPKGKSDWMLLLEQFLNLFWLLMIGAGILSMVTYVLDTTQPINLYVSIVLFAVTIFMCLLSFWEEKKARKAVRGFENLMPKQCAAIRDGGECEISAEELVVGDLVYIRNGTQVPADVRLLSCNELKLDNSSITGEAEPIEYTYEPADKLISVFESENVVINGFL